MKYFSDLKTVACGVWSLRTSFGPIRTKTFTNPSEVQNPGSNLAHFMQNVKLNKM